MKKIILCLLVLCGLAGCDKLDEKYKSQEVVTLTIASVRPLETLQYITGNGYVRPLYVCKEGGSEEWSVWWRFAPIQGFDEQYEEGYEYVIDVYQRWFRDSFMANIADGPACEYALKKVISKVRKDSEGIPEEYLKEE